MSSLVLLVNRTQFLGERGVLEFLYLVCEDLIVSVGRHSRGERGAIGVSRWRGAPLPKEVEDLDTSLTQGRLAADPRNPRGLTSALILIPSIAGLSGAQAT